MKRSYKWRRKQLEAEQVWLEGYYPKWINDFESWQEGWSPTPLPTHTYFKGDDYTEVEVRERLEGAA